MSRPHNEKSIAEQLADMRARQDADRAELLGPAPAGSPYASPRYRPPPERKPRRPARHVVRLQVRGADGYLRDCVPIESSARWTCGVCLSGTLRAALGAECSGAEQPCGAEVVTLQWSDEPDNL